MAQAAENTQELDAHLQEVVRALHGAVKQGVSHSNEPKVVDKAIEDCKEILEVIMAGKVEEWLH
jgi:hypothetical protein